MRKQIGQYLQYLRVERGASPHTLKSYREDLTALAEYLADEADRTPEPAGITMAELRGFVSALHEAGYAKTSIARRLASVRSFFRFGQREGWAAANPAKALRNPRKSKKLPHFLSSDEVGRLLDAPAGEAAMAARDRAILETLYSAGLRVSELVGMSDGDVDFAAGVVRVRGKGRRERLSPIGSFAARSLKAWLKLRKLSPREKQGREAPVFTNRLGTRLTTRSVARMLEKYLKVTGLDSRTSPHPLRNGRPTHLFYTRADIRSVQELLGHKSLVTTQIYTHVSTANLKAAYEKAHPRAR
jgi:integrase/recombinase XerC